MCLGNEKALSTTVQEIQKIFKIKINYNLDDYLGCKLLHNKSSIFIHQPHIYEHLIEKNLPIITDYWEYKNLHNTRNSRIPS